MLTPSMITFMYRPQMVGFNGRVVKRRNLQNFRLALLVFCSLLLQPISALTTQEVWGLKYILSDWPALASPQWRWSMSNISQLACTRFAGVTCSDDGHIIKLSFKSIAPPLDGSTQFQSYPFPMAFTRFPFLQELYVHFSPFLACPGLSYLGYCLY